MNAPLHLLMEAEAASPAYTSPQIPIHVATTLTGGGSTAQIVLQGMVYTLRITRAGKLILTK